MIQSDSDNSSTYCIHLFTRDFRTRDNLALISASQNFDYIIPVFIFDKRQIDPSNNNYHNEHVIQFMIQALSGLTKLTDDKIRCFEGNDYVSALKSIPEISYVSAITMCADVTPFARQRAKDIYDFCQERSIYFIEQEDFSLAGPDIGFKSGFESMQPSHYYLNRPLKTRSSFIKNIQPRIEPTNIKISNDRFITSQDGFNIRQYKYHYITTPMKVGFYEASRLCAFKRLWNFDIDDYSKHKQDPSKNVTTNLSSHLKFGLISIRELAIKTNEDDSLRNELYFRDFFYSLTYFFPDCINNWYSRLRNNDVEWTANFKDIQNFYDANTEYQYLNQRILELKETGRIHNRDRMYIAVYIHDKGIDWKFGEWLFAKYLIDYDQSINHWNWSWHSRQGVNNQWPGKKINLDKHIY